MRALFYLVFGKKVTFILLWLIEKKHRKDYSDTVSSLVNSTSHCVLSSLTELDTSWALLSYLSPWLSFVKNKSIKNQ